MNLRYELARPDLSEAEWQAVRRVIESGWVAQGPVVQRFEQAVADHCEAKHAVAMSSCTSALHLALVGAGIGAGDEVVVPSMSFIATANAIVHAGATPVFAEVDPDTFNLDLEDVRRRLSPSTRGIMLVDQLGLPADRDAFAAFAAGHGLHLIEDAACALGSRYRGAPVGAAGEFVCFSFHPRKLITTGEGGMVLTSSEEHADRLRRLRHQGMSVSDLERHRADRVIDESYPEVGFNARMTDLQAAVGIEQMKKLPAIISQRQRLARAYDAALADHPAIAPPFVPAHVDWNVQSYAVRLRSFDRERRDKVRQVLLEQGIATRAGVMTAHRESAYARPGPAPSLPVSEAASETSLILPLHGQMETSDCDVVADALTRAVETMR
jgi:dTDP-4-amino-4,6-dideoxygalactose transaminase